MTNQPHILPIKIECRTCLGDGFTVFGYTKPVKHQCTECEGRKHLWIPPNELLPSDERLR